MSVCSQCDSELENVLDTETGNNLSAQDRSAQRSEFISKDSRQQKEESRFIDPSTSSSHPTTDISQPVGSGKHLSNESSHQIIAPKRDNIGEQPEVRPAEPEKRQVNEGGGVKKWLQIIAVGIATIIAVIIVAIF